MWYKFHFTLFKAFVFPSEGSQTGHTVVSQDFTIFVSVFIDPPIGRFSETHCQPLACPLGANRQQSESSRNTSSWRSPAFIT